MPGPTVTEKLQELEGEVLALGNLVEGILIEAGSLLYANELDALERLNEEGRQVHKKRLAIEMGCLSLIGGRRPVDDELRSLVAMVEIAAELERMADHSRRVARTNYLTADHQLRKPLASLHRLATEVQSLLNGALAAFAHRDARTARTVTAETQEVEHLYQQVRGDLLAVMNSKPRIANQAIFLSRSAYNLRRTAERVAGICEWVVFIIEGSFGADQPAPGSLAHLTEKSSLAL
jgi:phosphate transport system protein